MNAHETNSVHFLIGTSRGVFKNESDDLVFVWILNFKRNLYTNSKHYYNN